MAPLLALLIPLIPQLVQATTKIIEAAREKGEISAADAKVQLDALAVELDKTVAAVRAVEIRDV